MNNVIPWFEIYVTDMSRARKFYEDVLDLKTKKMDVGDFDGEMYAFPAEMDAPGAAGALVLWHKQLPSSAGTIVYFTTQDCDTHLAKVEAAGGTIVQPKTSAGEYGFSALIQDTEGNTIGLFSQQ